MQPLGQNIIIREIPPETVGEDIKFYLPADTYYKVMVGEVIAVGPGKVLKNGEHRPPEVKKGDKVAFHRGSRNVWQDLPGLEGEYLTVLEDDILGILT